MKCYCTKNNLCDLCYRTFYQSKQVSYKEALLKEGIKK